MNQPIQDQRTGGKLFLITNGAKVLGVISATDERAAQASVNVNLNAGETYGALRVRPAQAHEAVAWHLGSALIAARNHTSARFGQGEAWLPLKNALLVFLTAFPECDPRTLESPCG